MRVLWWTGAFWPVIGGAQIYGVHLLRGLRRLGHELTVVTDDEDGSLAPRESFDGIPIVRLPCFRAVASRDLGQVAAVRDSARRILREFAPDLLHAHSVAVTALFWLASLGERATRLLVTKHELFASEMATGRDTLAGRALARADAIACPSVAVLEDIARVLPEVRPRAQVIPIGLPAPPPPAVAPSLDPPRLVCAGRVVRQKGMDVAIAAMPGILSRFPRAELRIAGDGPDREALEMQARRLGVRDAVRFLGWVPPDGVPALMAEAGIVVVPSRHAEGFPLVTIEAGHAERPVVASRIPGLDEAVVDGETGLLVPPDAPEALGRAIGTLLEDPRRAIRMGQRGRERGLTLCNLDRSIERHDRLYRQLGDRVVPPVATKEELHDGHPEVRAVQP